MWAITPDGAQWYGFDDDIETIGGIGGHHYGLYRSKDGKVSHFDIPGPLRVLKVAPDGSLYVGAGCGLLRYKLEKWETLANLDCAHSSFKTKPGYSPVPVDVAFGINGDVWVAGVLSSARFDGQTWTEYDIRTIKFWVAPDGSLWGLEQKPFTTDAHFVQITGNTLVTYTISTTSSFTAPVVGEVNH